MKFVFKFILTLILYVTCLPVFAQEDSLIYNIALDSVVIRANRYTSDLKSDINGVVELDMEIMDKLPKILGNADPMLHIQILPGVQTKGEYKSGINIHGCDNSHNMISISDVPIYSINHLLGLFSIFNASHYQTIELIKTPNSALFPTRLGGKLNVTHRRIISDSLSGEFAIGLISSQGTIRTPLWKKSDMVLSLRGSYLNLLYGSFIRSGGVRLRYSFYDANFTLRHKFNGKSQIIFDCYLGNDKGAFDEDKYLANMEAKWGNKMGALHWHYGLEDSSFLVKNTFYVSTYRNNFNLGVSDDVYKAPSDVIESGYKGVFSLNNLSGGLDFAYRRFNPQRVYYAVNHPDTNNFLKSYEASLYINYEQVLSKNFTIMAGIRGNMYCNGKTYTSVDPSLSLSYNNEAIKVIASYALRHQYLFQTGFVDSGLPTEFWLPCNDICKPQYSHSFLLGFSKYFAKGLFKIDLDIYYKLLYNQVEYRGAILDLLNPNYNYQEHLLVGDGNNVGFSFTLNKCAGKFSGWMGYAYTRARRSVQSATLNERFPASHERPHEVDVLITYQLNKHFRFGATYVFASGTPFTAPKSIALINGGIQVYYGDHNGMRLKSYNRLDVSIDYQWRCRYASEHGINFSLHNATASNNELFYGMKIKSDGSYAYRPVTFALKVMPSISYFCKF